MTEKKFNACHWDSRNQFKLHFDLWVRFLSRVNKLKGFALLRKAYRCSEKGYIPNPSY